MHFLGALPGLKLFFDACDLVCIPSKAESFGRVAIEAMAAGKAVVASDVSGLREIINAGGYRDWFASVMRNQLANSDARVIGDEKKKNAMVMAARRQGPREQQFAATPGSYCAGARKYAR